MEALEEKTRHHSIVEPRPGDLDQIVAGMEALQHRLRDIGGSLGRFYGEGKSGEGKSGAGNVRPVAGGYVPRMSELVEDLSDATAAIEAVVNRL